VDKDPLSGLLLDAGEIDRTRLATALQGLLGIDKATGTIVLKPEFNRLPARSKVLAFLLGRKVAKLLGKVESEAVPPKSIAAETALPSGTVKPAVRTLLEARLISQTDEGEYYVGSHQVTGAIERLREGNVE